MKPHTYKLERNALKRLATVQAMHPAKRFGIVPNRAFRFVVALLDDAGNVRAFCA